MSQVSKLVSSQQLHPPLTSPAATRLAAQLAAAVGGHVYPESIAVRHGVVFFMLRKAAEKHVGLLWSAAASAPLAGEFPGDPAAGRIEGAEVGYKIAPADPPAAAALRKHLPFTAARVLGLRKSIGFGDRLGLATPGHVRAVQGTDVAPVFAQQSIRELNRTQRTPQQVIDAATWGVFQAGYRAPYGADADHLKSVDDLEATFAAGFRMFTIDPSDHVDNAADTDPPDRLAAKFEAVPWPDLETSPTDCRAAYADKTFKVAPNLVLRFRQQDVLQAAVKYGAAVAHTCRLARHLATRATHDVELEMSVDETATPTSLLEHFFVASELKRLAVRCVSLAPRFVGEFEKGVDYKGDLHHFERQVVGHVAVSRLLGPYKLSVHSGSDKFSIYPILARHAGELIHVKTAGTSYLEALRVVALREPALFRQILDFARDRFETDKATYHVSASLPRVPTGRDLPDAQLAPLVDDPDTRQLLHVTFGSVLTSRRDDGQWLFRDRLLQVVAQNETAHYDTLSEHLARHVRPFARTNG
jgi:hypothetical protein